MRKDHRFENRVLSLLSPTSSPSPPHSNVTSLLNRNPIARKAPVSARVMNYHSQRKQRKSYRSSSKKRSPFVFLYTEMLSHLLTPNAIRFRSSKRWKEGSRPPCKFVSCPVPSNNAVRQSSSSMKKCQPPSVKKVGPKTPYREKRKGEAGAWELDENRIVRSIAQK